MKNTRLCLAIAAAIAAPALFAPVAQAQEAANPSSQSGSELDRVVVTARKREETLQEVPVAVTAFTAENLDKLNVQDLSDIGTQVPNMTVYAARGSSSTITAYIRGVGQSDPLWGVDPGVGIYMDDVYIARPQGALLDVFDVERVEVLRGPQGTLYGKNTIGGAIKYISRPLDKEFNGFGAVTLGNYGQRDLKAAVGGSVGDGALRARLSVADLNRDGFGENLVTGEDVSNKDIRAARFRLGAYVSDDIDFQFAYDRVDDKSGVRGAKMLAPNPFNSIPLYGGTGPVPPLDSRYDVRNGMPNINDTFLQGVSFTANVRANENWDLKYVAAKRESDTETNIDFDLTQDKIADVKAFYRDQQISHEVQAMYDGGGRSRGVFGLYYFNGEAGGQVLNNFFNLSFGDTQGTVYTKSFAAYADWTFDLGDKFKLTAGARWTDEDKHAVVLNRAYADPGFSIPIALVANFDKTINFKNVSPKISLDYELSPEVMLYGVASRGFKSGGYNIRAQATAVPRSAEPFQDEQVDSFEIGSKMGLLNDSLFLNLAAFHNKYKDIQLSIFTEYTTPTGQQAFFGDFTNAGSATVQGFEAEYQWLPVRNFVISGNLAWLDAKFDRYMFKGVNIADQQEFTNAPKFSGALNLEYRTELGNGGSLSARVGYAYQDRVVATTEVVRDPVTGVTTQPIVQDGYGLINAGVIWKPAAAWTLSLQGSNLADKEYMTTGYVIPALGVRSGFYGAPRQYSLSVRYDF